LPDVKRESYAAIDLGATSGRVMLGRFDGARLEVEEVHRFSNGPVRRARGCFWDWPRIESEVRRGLTMVAALDADVVSVGSDAWGHDHGFLAASGKLLEWPYAYLDDRTARIAERIEALMSPLELQARTAGFHVPLSALHQILATAEQRPELLHEAERLLFLPGLVNHALCGAVATEPCMASLTQLFHSTGGWDRELMEVFGVPARLFPPMGRCGESVGTFGPVGRSSQVWDVRLVAGHDTASAFAAVPLESAGDMVVSAGTWIMLGMETPRPVVSSETAREGLGSIRIPGDRWAVMNGMMGFYFLERFLQEEGAAEPAALDEQAAGEKPSSARFAPDRLAVKDGETFRDALRRVLDDERTVTPETRAGVARCIYDSLAEGAARAAHRLATTLGRDLRRLFVVGGGSRSELFSRLLANAAGVPVLLGITEATAIGNVLVQAWGRGRLASLSELRAVVRHSWNWREIEPSPDADPQAGAPRPTLPAGG